MRHELAVLVGALAAAAAAPAAALPKGLPEALKALGEAVESCAPAALGRAIATPFKYVVAGDITWDGRYQHFEDATVIQYSGPADLAEACRAQAELFPRESAEWLAGAEPRPAGKGRWELDVGDRCLWTFENKGGWKLTGSWCPGGSGFATDDPNWQWSDRHPLVVVSATSVRAGAGEAFGAARALDGDPATAWCPKEDDDTGGILALEFPSPVTVEKVSVLPPAPPAAASPDAGSARPAPPGFVARLDAGRELPVTLEAPDLRMSYAGRPTQAPTKTLSVRRDGPAADGCIAELGVRDADGPIQPTLGITRKQADRLAGLVNALVAALRACDGAALGRLAKFPLGVEGLNEEYQTVETKYGSAAELARACKRRYARRPALGQFPGAIMDGALQRSATEFSLPVAGENSGSWWRVARQGDDWKLTRVTLEP